jgi:hypothetical protein
MTFIIIGAVVVWLLFALFAWSLCRAAAFGERDGSYDR